MTALPRTDDDCRLAVQAWLENDKNYTHAADALGWDRMTLKRHVLEAAKRGMAPLEPVMPGYQISKLSTEQDEVGNTVRAFIQQKPDTGGKFNLPEGHRIKGVSSLVDAQGNVVQSWYKTREGQLSHEEIAKAVGAALREYEGAYLPPVDAGTTDAETLTVYPAVDWHIGLLAWIDEVGENYDLTIAREIILDSMKRLIAASPASESAIILGVGDLLHFDGYEPVTSRSRNFLDVDGRYPKVLKTATEMLIATVDLALQRHETVLVRILPGNHDDQSAVAVSLGLALYYSGHPRVTVDDSPSRFWWYRFGKVFLGATHGDRAKMKDLPLVMAHDRPGDWAASNYRRIYTGHLHHERQIEEGGVIVTCMRSPVARDAYHSFEKYRSGRSVYSETFRRDGSEAAVLKFNI